ncbi:Unknown protein sequence [Pseudomonas syringae pv. syringae]|nr:Unknown protein sequence [Pseudomonas syringae pv. syringae]
MKSTPGLGLSGASYIDNPQVGKKDFFNRQGSNELSGSIVGRFCLVIA